MRILQVITLYRPDFVGGATLVCERLARGLRERGHEIAIFCGRPDADVPPYTTSEWEIDGIPVTGVAVASGYVQLAAESYRHPAVAPVFATVLDRVAPDVVHVHSIQALGADLLAVAAARGIPVVLTMHDWWWYCARLFLVDPAGFICPPRVDPGRCHCAPGVDLRSRRAFLDRMLAHTRHVLAPSRFLADAIVANGLPRSHVEVCPNGVDAPRPRRPRPGPVRFGYIGGPDNRLKGLPALLDAAVGLDVGGWELALHGVAPGAVVIPAVIADRTRARPAFIPQALGTILAGLDCLVVPSLMRESFSLVTREALAAGLPVIVSDSGGPEEVVRHGVNGLVFATATASDLRTCMRRMVMEPDLLALLRDGARTTSMPSVGTQIDQVEAVYHRVRHAPPPPYAASRSTVPLDRVAFICGIDGAPRRYRVTNLCDQLHLHGIATTVLYCTEAGIPEAIERSDLVVLYRVPMGAYVGGCLAYARSLGRPVVFSCDDLVFERAAAPGPALARLPESERRGWLAFVDRYAETLRACDGFLGTTETLVAAAARLEVDGHVVPNGLGEAQLAAAERARKSAPPHRPDGVIRVAYLSGTIMHDLDLAVVEPALAAVLAARPDVRLRLVGYLRHGPALAPYRDRIERLPFLPWHDLFTCLAEVDVNLAPLADLGSFSDAKSAVKYLEAAAVGVPTIASPTAAFRSAIADGDNGRLAGPERWQRVLLDLVDDAAERRRLGNAAYVDAFLHHTPAAQADALLTALHAIATSRARRSYAPVATRAGGGPSSSDDPRSSGGPTSSDDPRSSNRQGSSNLPRSSDSPSLPERYPDEVGRYDLEPVDAVVGTAVSGRDTPSGFLLPGRAVGQRFRAAHDGLYRIDVCVGTDGRRNDQHVTVHVTDRVAPDATDLRRVTLDANTFADRAWIAAEFPPIADSAGRTLYVWLESEDAHDGDAITLWTYVEAWGEEPPTGLHLDHAPTPGSLTFRTFHLRSEREPYSPSKNMMPATNRSVAPALRCRTLNTIP